MSEQLIIGLYSPAPQSGKSTVAKRLTDTHGFTRKGFADTLRRMARALLLSLGFRSEEVDHYVDTGEGKATPLAELAGHTPRHVMQTLGTEWGRDRMGADFWVKAVINNRAPSLLVIDDVRFPNEYAAIVREGGQVWCVIRPGAAAPNGHPSEGLLAGYAFDEVLTNDGTLADLEKKTDLALSGPA